MNEHSESDYYYAGRGFDQPETVKFQSQGMSCVAFITVGVPGLNMRSCQITFPIDRPVSVNLEYIPGATRVQIENGLLWFDTDEQSATEIEHLFQTKFSRSEDPAS